MQQIRGRLFRTLPSCFCSFLSSSLPGLDFRLSHSLAIFLKKDMIDGAGGMLGGGQEDVEQRGSETCLECSV
jgi:hypothetical protein